MPNYPTGIIPPDKTPHSHPVDTQESVPQVDGPAEPLPEKGNNDDDDNDCIITNYTPPTKEYTTVVIGNSKELKAAMATPLA